MDRIHGGSYAAADGATWRFSLTPVGGQIYMYIFPKENTLCVGKAGGGHAGRDIDPAEDRAPRAHPQLICKLGRDQLRVDLWKPDIVVAQAFVRSCAIVKNACCANRGRRRLVDTYDSRCADGEWIGKCLFIDNTHLVRIFAPVFTTRVNSSLDLGHRASSSFEVADSTSASTWPGE
jgi:hypothetical protein